MSDKSISQKLLIKSGYKVLLVNSPDGYAAMLGELPSGVMILTHPDGQADLIQVFIKSKAELQEQLPSLKPYLKPKGLLWLTYPKGTSGIKTDINRDSIWEYGRTVGFESVAMISIDATWSAMRLKAV